MDCNCDDDAKAKNGLNTSITSTCMQCPRCINSESKYPTYNSINIIKKLNFNVFIR
jgi:hypothetical protein